MMKPYSIRDLRSAFKTDELRRLGGDYDYTTRRWRFASAAQAIDAGKLVSSLGNLISLHDPDAVRHADAIRVRGGFSVVAHNDDGKNKRGTGFYIFSTEDDRFEASRYLFEHTRADSTMIASLRAALRDAPDDLLGPRPTSQILEATLAARPKIGDVERLTARAIAARNTRPVSASAAADSRRDVFERAKATIDAMRFPAFEEIAAPANGRIVGILVGRSAHHLAVRTHEDGRGVILDRWKIATPLRQQGAVERAFDERAAFGVDLENGYGTALQIRGAEPDFYLGALRMNLTLAAQDAGVLPILQHEDFQRGEDYLAAVVAADDALGAALDAGAYGILGSHADFGVPNLHEAVAAAAVTIRRGPSFATSKAISRSR